MGKGKRADSIVSLVITAVIAVAAIAAVVVLIVTQTNKKDTETSDQASASQATALLNECSAAAQTLMQDNYTVIRLFVTEGLAYKTVYGNPAEDGYYSVDDDVYKHYSQIEELVKGVYVAEEAERILTRFPVKVDGGTKDMQIYTEHKDPSTAEMCLGITDAFKPDTEYTRDWSQCMISVHPESDTACTLKVILNGYTEEQAAAHPESVLTANMVKQNGEWRLQEMLR